MHKIKDHEDEEVNNDAKFVALLWKVGAKVSEGKPNIQKKKKKNKPNFALFFLIL
jgi:hypothetical protein